jgi:hypothetical protein
MLISFPGISCLEDYRALVANQRPQEISTVDPFALSLVSDADAPARQSYMELRPFHGRISARRWMSR